MQFHEWWPAEKLHDQTPWLMPKLIGLSLPLFRCGDMLVLLRGMKLWHVETGNIDFKAFSPTPSLLKTIRILVFTCLHYLLLASCFTVSNNTFFATSLKTPTEDPLMSILAAEVVKKIRGRTCHNALLRIWS